MWAAQQLLSKIYVFAIDKAHLPAYNSGKISVVMSIAELE